MQGKLAELRKEQIQYRVPRKTNLDHFLIVLQFPNVTKALSIISRKVEIHRLEYGFSVLKSIKSPLTRRELQEILNVKKEKSSRLIQRVIRGCLGRCKTAILREVLRHQRTLKFRAMLSLRLEVRDNKKQRLYLHKKNERRKQHSVIMIQRVIRGYFGRSVVKLMARSNLVAVLKIWSHGNTLSIKQRPALQETSSQLYLDVIIHTAQCSSRPVKLLPKTGWFKECVETILKLGQLEKTHKLSVQKEYINRQFERLRMIDEDKESILHSRLYNKTRRDMAEASRNKDATALRDNLERQRRAQQIAEKAGKEDTKKMKTNIELMKIEDYRSNHLREYSKYLSQVVLDCDRELMLQEDYRATQIRQADNEQQKLIASILFQREKIKSILKRVSKSTEITHTEHARRHETLQRTWRSYQQGIQKTTTELRIDRLLSQSLFVGTFVMKPSKEYNVLKWFASQIAPMLESREVRYYGSREGDIGIKNKMCLVSSSFQVEKESINLFIHLKHLRLLRTEREFQYVLLQTSYSSFVSKHYNLQKLREKLLKDKILTRRERKTILDEILSIEENIILIREAVISGTLLLYQLCLDEVDLYVRAFEPENITEVVSHKVNPTKKQGGRASSNSIQGGGSKQSNSVGSRASKMSEIQIKKSRSISKDTTSGEAKATDFKFCYHIGPRYTKEFPSLPSLSLSYSNVDDNIKNVSKQPGWTRFCGKVENYSFSSSASTAITWYQRQFLPWLRKREIKWKEDNRARMLSSLQRVNWLSSKFKYDTTDRDLHNAKFLHTANILDLKEIFLWRCSMNVNVYDPETQKNNQLVIPSSLLDKCLKRHPASAVAKLLIDTGLLSAENCETFKKITESPLAFTSLPTSSSSSKPPLVYNSVKKFRIDFVKANLEICLSKANKALFHQNSFEIFESAGHTCNGMLIKWLSRGGSDFAIRSQFIYQKLENFSCALTTAKTEFSELRHMVDTLFDLHKPFIYFNPTNKLIFDEENCNVSLFVKAFKTDDEFNVSFPTWMKPSYHFGRPAPKVSFEDRLSREKLSGEVNGKYAQLVAKEKRVEEKAKMFVRILMQKRLIYKKKLEYAKKDLIVRHKKLQDEIESKKSEINDLDNKISKILLFGKTKLKEKRSMVLRELNDLLKREQNLSLILPATITPDDFRYIVDSVTDNTKDLSSKSTWLLEISEKKADLNGITRLGETDYCEMWVCGGLESVIVIYRVVTDENDPRGKILLLMNDKVNGENSEVLRLFHALRCGFNDRPLDQIEMDCYIGAFLFSKSRSRSRSIGPPSFNRRPSPLYKFKEDSWVIVSSFASIEIIPTAHR